MMELKLIASKIYEIRAQKVMLDFDLAELYGVETRVLNQAILRNSSRFPPDFMFRLEESEWHSMMSQFVISSQMTRKRSSLPYAFTEHGVTMLASVLRSKTAIMMNVAIVRTFIAMKKSIIDMKDVADQLLNIKERIGVHDVQLNEIYTAIENLLDSNANQKNWVDRERIGFRKA